MRITPKRNPRLAPPPGIEPGSPKGPDLKSGAIPLSDGGIEIKEDFCLKSYLFN